MRIVRSRVVLAAIAALSLVGVACASDSSTTSAASGAGVCAGVDKSGTDALAKVCSSGTLRVATDAKYKPASWYDVKTGDWNGFDVDVAAEIAKRLGVTSEPQAEQWAAITAGSWNDRWDVSVGSMTDTVDREELFTFSPAYYYTPAAAAVYDTNTSISDVGTDLDGKNICVGVATTYQDYVNHKLVLGAGAPPFEFQVDDAQLTTSDTDTTALDNLAQGDGLRCDAAISALPIIQAYIDDGGPLKVIGDPLYFEPLSIAFDKNSPVEEQTLADAVSKIVEDMHADGTLSALSQKWWHTDLTTTEGSGGSASPSS